MCVHIFRIGEKTTVRYKCRIGENIEIPFEFKNRHKLLFVVYDSIDSLMPIGEAVVSDGELMCGKRREFFLSERSGDCDEQYGIDPRQQTTQDIIDKYVTFSEPSSPKVRSNCNKVLYYGFDSGPNSPNQSGSDDESEPYSSGAEYSASDTPYEKPILNRSIDMPEDQFYTISVDDDGNTWINIVISLNGECEGNIVPTGTIKIYALFNKKWTRISKEKMEKDGIVQFNLELKSLCAGDSYTPIKITHKSGFTETELVQTNAVQLSRASEFNGKIRISKRQCSIGIMATIYKKQSFYKMVRCGYTLDLYVGIDISRGHNMSVQKLLDKVDKLFSQYRVKKRLYLIGAIVRGNPEHKFKILTQEPEDEPKFVETYIEALENASGNTTVLYHPLVDQFYSLPDTYNRAKLLLLISPNKCDDAQLCKTVVYKHAKKSAHKILSIVSNSSEFNSFQNKDAVVNYSKLGSTDMLEKIIGKIPEQIESFYSYSLSDETESLISERLT